MPDRPHIKVFDPAAFDAHNYRVAALVRAAKAVAVADDPYLDDGTVKMDARNSWLLLRIALLTDLLIEAGGASELAWLIFDDCTGEDLMRGRLNRCLEAAGVPWDELFTFPVLPWG